MGRRYRMAGRMAQPVRQKMTAAAAASSDGSNGRRAPAGDMGAVPEPLNWCTSATVHNLYWDLAAARQAIEAGSLDLLADGPYPNYVHCTSC